LEQYRWSSYRAYVGKDIAPDWLTVDYILSAIGKRNLSARYISYVADGNEEALVDRYNQKRMKAILGDDNFKTLVLKGRKPRVDIPELKAARVKPILKQIVSKTCKFYGIKEKDIWVSTRGKGVKTPARSVAMYLCQNVGDMPLSKIADAFDLASYASAGATIRTIKQRMDEDKKLYKDINTIMLDLTPS